MVNIQFHFHDILVYIYIHSSQLYFYILHWYRNCEYEIYIHQYLFYFFHLFFILSSNSLRTRLRKNTITRTNSYWIPISNWTRLNTCSWNWTLVSINTITTDSLSICKCFIPFCISFICNIWTINSYLCNFILFYFILIFIWLYA